jgi:LysR family glycine cleavage system transcriptional activator
MTYNRNRLPLNALRTFEVAARLLSFKQTAEELCVTPTTVSAQIRHIEKEWSCTLFVRTPRKLSLTEEGQSLARVVQQSFDNIRDELETHFPHSRKTVTLAVGPIFGSRWLLPRMGTFKKDNPHIDLVLQHGPRVPIADQLISQISIVWGDGFWPGIDTAPLFDITYNPMINPQLLAKCGGIAQLEDLAKFPIIHQHDRSEWQAWLKFMNHKDLRFPDETVISDSNLVAQAVIDGHGIALGVFPLMQAELAAGHVVCPFDAHYRPNRSYHMITRPRARQVAEVGQVCRWLEAQVAL